MNAAAPVPVIETRALRKVYAEGSQAEVVALAGVDLRVAPGEFAGQYDLSAFEKAANCKMAFNANPAAEKLNGMIQGNPDLPPEESENYTIGFTWDGTAERTIEVYRAAEHAMRLDLGATA